MNLCPGGPSSVSEPSIGWSPDSAELIAFCSSRDSQGFPISVTEPSLGPCLKLIPLTQCRKSQRHHKLTHPCSPFRRDAPDWAAPSLIVRKATRSAREYCTSRCVTPGSPSSSGDGLVGRTAVGGRTGASSGQDNEGARHTIATRGLSLAFPFLCDDRLPSARSSAASLRLVSPPASTAQTQATVFGRRFVCDLL